MLTSTNFLIKILYLLYSTLYPINYNMYVMHLIFLFSILNKGKKEKKRTLEYKVRILILNFQFEGG